MKKWMCALVCLALLAAVLSGCGGGGTDSGKRDSPSAAEGAGERDADAGDAPRVVTTIFPVYDWVRQIAGGGTGDADLTLLLGNGVDLHSYQPTVDDMVKISACDLFIYVGGESDKWVKDALSEAVNENMIVINLLETLGDRAREEELVEGMEAEDEEEAEEGEADGGGEEIEYDEHVWLSLKNARLLCGAIAGALSALDPDGAERYAENLAAYRAELSALDAQYESAVRTASGSTLLFADRFPFRYLVDDYGLRYYAAFSGCSAETEASFETVIFLSGKVDELGLDSVLTLENSDGKIARTIVENTAAKSARVLSMDSLQSTTARDVADGKTYLGAMESNLEILREALG